MSLNRILGWVLAASLTINVFLAAAMLTQVWRNPRPPGPPHPGAMIERMAEGLAPADADILRAAFARHRPDLDQARQGVDAHFDAIRRAMEAEPFDPPALQAAFASGEELHRHMGRAMAETLAEAAAAMTPEGRKRLARQGPPPPPPSR